MRNIVYSGKYATPRIGVTLLEVAIVMMVATAAIGSGGMMYASHLKNQTNMVAAQQMKDVSRAFERYITDNYAQVLSDTRAMGWLRVPVSELVPQYLKQSFSNQNVFGQEYVLAVKRPVSSMPNHTGLDAVVFTTGGEEISSDRALSIAQAIGTSGGFTLKGGSPTQVRSTFDGYNLDLNDFGDPAPDSTGKLVSAIFMGEGGSMTMDYLHRERVAGRPELNRMDTSLDMNDNNIDKIQNLNTQNVHVSQDLYANGRIDGSNLYIEENLEVGGDAIITASLNANEIHALNNIMVGNDLIADGNMEFSGNAVGRTLMPTLAVKIGSSCTAYPVGAIAKSKGGELVSCWKTGFWQKAIVGEFGGSYLSGRKVSSYNSGTGGYGCPSGFTDVNLGLLSNTSAKRKRKVYHIGCEKIVPH